MSDVAGSSVASPGTQPDNPAEDDLPALEAQDRCIHCQADLTGDRRLARFCPRCGARRVDLAGEASPPVAPNESATPFSDHLIASEANDVMPPAEALPPPPGAMPAAAQAAAWLQLSMNQGARAGAAFGPHRPNDDDVHSLMLLGYANAMYRLGWRYETGLGSGRNPQEALRCYFKAAKLGNIAALSRLAPQCVASVATPAPMNPANGGGVGPGEPPPLSTPS